MSETHIGPRPPDSMYRDGVEIDCQCARCGSSCDWTDCDCEDGFSHHDCGEDCCCCLNPINNVTCDFCYGKGGWYMCLSSPGFCESNPLPGRENIKRGEIEWFTYEVNDE